MVSLKFFSALLKFKTMTLEGLLGFTLISLCLSPGIRSFAGIEPATSKGLADVLVADIVDQTGEQDEGEKQADEKRRKTPTNSDEEILELQGVLRNSVPLVVVQDLVPDDKAKQGHDAGDKDGANGGPRKVKGLRCPGDVGGLEQRSLVSAG